MSKEITTLKSETDWERFHAMSEQEVDLSEIPEITPEEFGEGRLLHEILAERGIEYDASEIRTARAIHSDGTVTEHWLPGKAPKFTIAPDLFELFPTSEAVEAALRSLLSIRQELLQAVPIPPEPQPAP